MTGTTEIVKVSFNLPRIELGRLKDLARRRSIPVTQALRQAIISELYIQSIADRGAKLLVREKDGSMQEIVFSQTQTTDGKLLRDVEEALSV